MEKLLVFFVENSLAASTFTDTRCFYHANNHPTFLVCWLLTVFLQYY